MISPFNSIKKKSFFKSSNLKDKLKVKDVDTPLPYKQSRTSSIEKLKNLLGSKSQKRKSISSNMPPLPPGILIEKSMKHQILKMSPKKAKNLKKMQLFSDETFPDKDLKNASKISSSSSSLELGNSKKKLKLSNEINGLPSCQLSKKNNKRKLSNDSSKYNSVKYSKSDKEGKYEMIDEKVEQICPTMNHLSKTTANNQVVNLPSINKNQSNKGKKIDSNQESDSSIVKKPDLNKKNKKSLEKIDDSECGDYCGWLSNVTDDSYKDANRLLEFILYPVTPTKFFRDLWEKKPLLIRRHNENYNKGIFSTADLDKILREETVNFGENVDIVSYLNDVRETHNPEGRAHAAVVWDFYQQGCSVRLLNPQTYSKPVWNTLATLQEYFSSMAGANVYLTPPGTQGFAPHWDDIEAFIVQLEGKKLWKLYEPRTDADTLPRFSSPNFTSKDLPQPILEITLEPGDLLYFPRGYIHQGSTLDDSHSLHITISVGQRNSWGDLIEKLIPRAVEIALEEDLDFRRSLPPGYLNYMGVAFSDNDDPMRAQFLKTLKGLITRLWSFAPTDSAVDQMAKRQLQISLPPCLTEKEKSLSIFGQGEKWDSVNHEVVNCSELEPDTLIRIIRKGSIRLISEENVSIYHNLENARVYEGAVSKCIEIDEEEAECLEILLKRYPKYTKIEKLPIDPEKQMSLVTLLYDRGLISTKRRLVNYDEGKSNDDSNEDTGDLSDDDDSV